MTGATEERQCDGCAECCREFEVKILAKPPRTPCEHSFPGHGCGAYDVRPRCCQRFDCLWKLGAFPIQARPDRIGVLFIPGPADSPLALAIGKTPIQAHECRERGLDNALSRAIISALSDEYLVDVIRGDAREILCPAWMKPKILALIEAGDGN